MHAAPKPAWFTNRRPCSDAGRPEEESGQPGRRSDPRRRAEWTGQSSRLGRPEAPGIAAFEWIAVVVKIHLVTVAARGRVETRVEIRRCNLDLFVYGEEIVFAQCLPAGQSAHFAIVEISQHGCRIEAIGLIRIDIACHDIAAVRAVMIDRQLKRYSALRVVGHR